MTTSKDFCLIPAELIHKLSGFLENKSSYKMSKIAEMDMEMKKILDSNTPLEDKIYLYNQVLRNYIDSKQEEPIKVEKMQKTTESTPLSSLTPRKRKIYDEVMEQFTTKPAKQKASGIMSTLATQTDKNTLDINNEGQIVLKGETIPSSHITDVVDFLVKPEKATIPERMRDIYPIIQTLNFPQKVLNNSNKSAINKMLYGKRTRTRPRRED